VVDEGDGDGDGDAECVPPGCLDSYIPRHYFGNDLGQHYKNVEELDVVGLWH